MCVHALTNLYVYVREDKLKEMCLILVVKDCEVCDEFILSEGVHSKTVGHFP